MADGRWRTWTLIGRRLAVVPVQHEPWPFYDAALADQHGTLLSSLGLPELPGDPLLHWSIGADARLDGLVWASARTGGFGAAVRGYGWCTDETAA
jgi:uncharacterized protein YqjF (DUF2071 family)